MYAFQRIALFAGIGALAALGCSDPVGKLHPVSGSVSVDGQPLKRGSISFRPDKARGNDSRYEPAADIDEDGTYELRTHGKPGAPAGAWKVMVLALEPINPKDPYSKTRSLVDAKYQSPETSGLAVEVVESPSAGTYDLRLSSKRK